MPTMAITMACKTGTTIVRMTRIVTRATSTVTALAMSATRTLMATAQVMSKRPMRVLTPTIRTLHPRRLLPIKMMMAYRMTVTTARSTQIPSRQISMVTVRAMLATWTSTVTVFPMLMRVRQARIRKMQARSQRLQQRMIRTMTG